MSTKESTVAEWLSHFQVNQNLTLPEYQIDWTTIRNNAEGVGVEVAMGTVRKYLERFREQNEPMNSDPVASILGLQSQLGGLTLEAEHHLNQCKYLANALSVTLSLLQENQAWAELSAKAAHLESELRLSQSQVETLKVQADTQKELRLRTANRTVYGS